MLLALHATSVNVANKEMKKHLSDDVWSLKKTIIYSNDLQQAIYQLQTSKCVLRSS